MIDDMRMRKLSDKTQSHYIRAVRQFAGFLGRSPDSASVEDLRRYQLHLVDRGTSPDSLNAAITGLKFFFEVTLDQHLSSLQAAEFIYERSLFPDLEYTFKHALTHDVAYGGLLQERRKALHTTIIESIERLYADRLTEQVEKLAHHAVRSEVWEKAFIYSRQAAEKAMSRSANREAWSHLEQAISAVAHLPLTNSNLEHAIDLRLAARNCLHPLGEYPRALELGLEAESLARSLKDPRRETLVHCTVSIALTILGRSAEGIEHGERALAIAESLQDPMLRIAARYPLGSAHTWLSAFGTALDFLQCDVGLEPEQLGARLLQPWGASNFEEVFTRAAYCMCQQVAAFCLEELGQFNQALLQANRSVKFAQTLDILFLRALADAALVMCTCAEAISKKR
jgi:tetratricopeptide (TPR) repeat protein